MNEFKLCKTFDQIRYKTGMDYAIVYPDSYGDCNTCVNSELADEFGIDSKGIWCKNWTTGINASKRLSKQKEAYIAHDITEEQADKMVEIFKANGYFVTPEKYDSRKCYVISEELESEDKR